MTVCGIRQDPRDAETAPVVPLDCSGTRHRQDGRQKNPRFVAETGEIYGASSTYPKKMPPCVPGGQFTETLKSSVTVCGRAVQ